MRHLRAWAMSTVCRHYSLGRAWSPEKFLGLCRYVRDAAVWYNQGHPFVRIAASGATLLQVPMPTVVDPTLTVLGRESAPQGLPGKWVQTVMSIRVPARPCTMGRNEQQNRYFVNRPAGMYPREKVREPRFLIRMDGCASVSSRSMISRPS